MGFEKEGFQIEFTEKKLLYQLKLPYVSCRAPRKARYNAKKESEAIESVCESDSKSFKEYPLIQHVAGQVAFNENKNKKYPREMLESKQLYWQDCDYQNFKDSALFELELYMIQNKCSTKEAIKALYQPNSKREEQLIL